MPQEKKNMDVILVHDSGDEESVLGDNLEEK